MVSPWDTRSPTLILNPATVPAAGDGISIVALSDSSVTSGSSGFTTSPGFTSTSITGTSLKSPMSGTFTSMVAIATPLALMHYVRMGTGSARRSSSRAVPGDRPTGRPEGDRAAFPSMQKTQRSSSDIRGRPDAFCIDVRE